MNTDTLRAPYQQTEAESIELGSIILDQAILPDAPVNLMLRSFNRHGLIAGATGSGKTKTMQVLCEQLSKAGVPTLVMDIKGDVSGLGMKGDTNDFLENRCETLHMEYTPTTFPVELLSLNGPGEGVPLRSTVDDFGAILFSRMLDLNETQSGVITMLFEYAKKNNLPLIDLEDIRALLRFAQSDAGKSVIESEFGGVAISTAGIIIRKIIELEAQGGGEFFGEPSFEVRDLVRVDAKNQGIISVLRLMDMQDKPKLFSTFMLKLLSDIYRQFKELGDPEKPVLVLFIDEAHLIFKNASKALYDMLENMIKLIRSKGVGIFFCTQIPNDIPDAILSQLGLKIQHALRAFTAKDRTAMKLVSQNFPPSEFYNTEQLLTSLSIGEALVTALDGKGQPTPLVQCMIRPPQSRMGTISHDEIMNILSSSKIYGHYHQKMNVPSAKDLLTQVPKEETKLEDSVNKEKKIDSSMLNSLSKNTLFRQLSRDFFKAILSAIGIKKK